MTPPAVTDLAASTVKPTRLTLTWTATGDDGNTGTAAAYDLRHSTAPIDAGNFDLATPIPGVPAPKGPVRPRAQCHRPVGIHDLLFRHQGHR